MQLAGANVLRRVAHAVQPHDRHELAPLIARMTRILTSGHNQGISAPQLGESRRVFMLAQPGDEPFAVVNPRVLRRSRELCVDWEKCLSIPGYAGLVERARRIQVEYETVDGDPISATLDGDASRVFQHELDHLDGILYTSRMIPGSFAHESLVEDRQHGAARRASIEASVGVE